MPHGDHGAQERNEDGRPGGDALAAEHDGVTALVHQDQQHEADGERHAPLDRVQPDAEDHRRERVQLEDARQQADELELAQDEEADGARAADQRVARPMPA